jgi:nicotinamide phosphoribosyltransferase
MKNTKENIILLSDSYKVGHHAMYPEGTQNIYSYFESRIGAKFPETVFFGLQMYLKKYFVGQVVTQADIDEAKEFCKAHFAGMEFFNLDMWQYIVDFHDGKLPLRITAVREGTPVPVSNVLMAVEITDETINPRTKKAYCAPLTNFFETILTHVWHPSNVATISRDIKKHLKNAFDKTVPDELGWLVDYMLHDFGFRGVSSIESAGMGGAGHLVNFKGTDTLIAIKYAQRYYNTTEMVGHSVAASEHNIMTAEGKDGEFKVVERLINEYQNGILSVVSDSYDIENALKEYGTTFREAILNRGEGAKFVVRPDSPRFEGDTPADQILWIVKQLEKDFGATVNVKGYKMLHPKVGVIYGDGLSRDEIIEAIDTLVANGYAASNCVFGMGGGLLQKHNRDTQRNAFKSSAQKRDGVWHKIFKNPKDTTKASKRGRLALVKADAGLTTVQENEADLFGGNLLELVFENGKLIRDMNWNEVREAAKV